MSVNETTLHTQIFTLEDQFKIVIVEGTGMLPVILVVMTKTAGINGQKGRKTRIFWFPEIQTGTACNKDTQSVNQCSDPNAVCSNTVSKCVCTDDFYFNNSTKNCTQKVGVNQPCKINVECQTGLTCISKSCTCGSSKYWNGSNCANRIGGNQPCKINVECQTGLTCISKSCTCGSSTYWNGSNCANIPSPPKSVKIRDATTDKLTIEIVPGEGRADSFDILFKQRFLSSVVVKKDTSVTITDINGLEPGTLYQNFTVIAVSNGVNSSQTTVPDSSTKPSAPASVLITSETTKTISITVSKGPGIVQRYYILKNETYYKTVSVTNNSLQSNTLIDRLQPGTAYNSFSVVAMSNNVNSTEIVMRPHATLPEKPLDIIQKTSRLSGMIVEVTAISKANHDLILVIKDLKNTNNVSTAEINSNRTSNGFLYTVSELQIGTCYHLVVYSTFSAFGVNYTNPDGLKTSNPVCTLPEKPDSITQTSSNLTSMTFDIGYKNNVDIKAIDITVVIRDMKNKNISSIICNRAIDRNTCTGNSLHVGNCYQACAYSRLNAIYLNPDPICIEKACTHPEKPSIEFLNSTTNIITILINKGYGGIDGYEIYVNKQLKEHGTYTEGTKKVQIRGIIPGTRSNVFALAIANKLRSKKSEDISCLTYPSPPKIQVIERTNTTILLKIEPGQGSVERLFILVNGSVHSQVSLDSSKTSMTISSLQAGTVYNLRVKATSNNLTSASSNAVINATYPSPPISIRIIETKKDSVTIKIVKGKGLVKRYVVSVNGRDINVPASLNKDATVYTISGLDSATSYPIKVSAVSSGEHKTELASIQMSLTTEKDPIPVAIGGVFGGCAALVVILIIVLSWRRQALCFKENIHKEVEQGNMNAGFEEEVELEDNRRKRPIKVSEFHRHVEMMSGNSNMGFSQEFKELGILSPKHSTEVSQIQENRPKNRYTNILPFDHSRVKLIGIEDETGSDFINANYIPGKRSKREFIATQGPLPSTKEEMWRMIWEQNVSSIVMLTQLLERGRKKCEIYWPENTNEKMFLGDIIVEVETLSHLSDYTLRTIALRLGDVERRIKHYNYLSWPDMGTPKTSSNMINFVDTVRKEIQPNMNGPIIVHCSAGVGRTGTFIVMDILMQEIRSKCTHVDIFGTVLNMRNYRLNMVQTEDQYVFIHNCVRDLLDVSDDEEEDRIEEENAYLNEPIYQNVDK
ncbi:receptor-type tyrosine-protein phosphatase eta-like [Mytilus trossulus]|uniref:receptor-type tyrosine-protein phosphatase eta-like n=1 Tax=Mytilus trossulus TaxID=6551 RepID=UPI003007D661